MPRVKKHIEEFNPWPPFVDVFSSVILVLLLFLLVTIVNIAHYMQFNATVSTKSTVESQENNLNAGVDITDMVTLKKTVAPSSQSEGKASLFGGGDSAGNALAVTKDEKTVNQNVDKTAKELIVRFNSGDIFADKDIQKRVLDFIKMQKKIDKGMKIEISVANSTMIPSTTVSKQISIGRALNIKNLIKKSDFKLSNISLNVKSVRDENYKHGYVKLKVIQ